METTAIASRSRRLWLHPASTFLFGLISIIAVNLIVQWHNFHGEGRADAMNAQLAIVAIGLALFAYEGLKLIVTCFRKDARGLFAHALAIAILFSCVHFGKEIHFAVQRANLVIFSRMFEACEESALSYADAQSFKICSSSKYGAAFDSVVYDSAGQLRRPRSEWSSEFRRLLSQKQFAIISECGLAAVQQLRGNFFLVNSDCESTPK